MLFAITPRQCSRLLAMSVESQLNLDRSSIVRLKIYPRSGDAGKNMVKVEIPQIQTKYKKSALFCSRHACHPIHDPEATMRPLDFLTKLPLVASALFGVGAQACDECDDVEDSSVLCARDRVHRLNVRQDLGNLFPIREYPDEQKANVTRYLTEARKLARDDLCESQELTAPSFAPES